MEIRTADQAQAYGRTLLQGDRVRLRAVQEEDLPVLERWWEDPEFQPLQRFAVRPAPSGSGAATIRGWSANADASGAGFSVVDRDADRLVGHVALWGAQLPERAAVLAIQIGAEHLGRGYGTDAVRTMVRYGFLAMGLNRVQLNTFAFPRRTAATSRPATRRNRLRGPSDRARRAYARAGFREEGVRREVLWIDGGFADEVIMSILRWEWTP